MKILNKRIGFGLVGLLLLSLMEEPIATRQPTRAQGRQPNIVFIMSDDHAAQAISAYGSKLIRTPNLDRLAQEGMKFENCFVTNSICTPSRAAILTGKYSHINGVPVFNHIDTSQPLLSKYMQQSGYYTGMIGKWHLGGQNPYVPEAGKPAGFDYWNILPGQGAYFDPVMIEMGTRKNLKGYTTDIITTSQSIHS
jgi:arylsulfatase A-like enzyme